MYKERTKVFKDSNQTNPIITHRYGADPYAMEYQGRVYVYMTNDILEYKDGEMIENTYQKINTINCVSSADMVNWTDHGSLKVAGSEGAAKWAKNSWAPAAAHKKINEQDKFFLYFADSGKGIGVVTSDTPIGPWIDPIDGPIASTKTANCADVLWCFDPAVWVDDDNRAFLYFGGGVPEGKGAMPNTARAVELGEDMISLKGTPVMIEAPYLFEDSGINKIGDTYYYSYCSNFDERNDPSAKIVLETGQINYMTSKNPLGPFVYQKPILKNPGSFFGGWGNNHHCFIKFKGDYYMFWHTQTLRIKQELPAKGYRCTHVDKMTVNEDGTIESIEASYTGVSQLQPLNPYQVNRTDTFAWTAGIDTIPSKDDSRVMCLTGIDTGDYIGISGVEFTSEGASAISVMTASVTDGCAINIYLDSMEKEAVATIQVPNTLDLEKFTKTMIPLDRMIGNHNVFFVFEGKDFAFDSWQFSR